MPENAYLENAVPKFFRRNALDIIIHTWITATRNVLPSVTIQEAAMSCMKFYGISEDQMTLKSVISTYNRVHQELLDKDAHEKVIANGKERKQE